MAPLRFIADVDQQRILNTRQASHDPPSDSDNDGTSSAHIFLATFGALALFVFAISYGHRKGALTRQRRRERSLRQNRGRPRGATGSAVSGTGGNENKGEEMKPVPAFYEVQLEQEGARDPRANTMPLSASLVLLPLPNSSTSPTTPFATPQGTAISSALADLAAHLWKSVRDHLPPRRKHKRPSLPSSLPHNTLVPQPPPSQKVATSVFIAMPTPHGQSYPSQSLPGVTVLGDTTIPNRFKEIPEVLVGVCEVPMGL